MARTRSASNAIRVRGSVPWLASSSRFHPAPTPNKKRPPDTRSRLDTALAVTIGSRSVTRHTAVPSLRLVVTAATAARATNGS